jgi:hypothetical protein
MNLGTLVAKKMRWSLTSLQLGIIIDKSNKKDYWLVLWTQNGVYRIQEHLEYALIDLATCAEKDLKIRKCTSM